MKNVLNIKTKEVSKVDDKTAFNLISNGSHKFINKEDAGLLRRKAMLKVMRDSKRLTKVF